MTSKLYTDEEIGFERVFEIRIRDIRERNGITSKSFSLSVKKGTKDNEYLSAEELREKLKSHINNKNHYQKL